MSSAWVNAHLLDKVSDDHRGLSLYVEPEENIEVKVSSFTRKISEPILTDLSLDPGKIRMRDIYPLTLPDIFSGEQLLLLGRYEGDGATAITLKGYADGKGKRFVYEDRLPKESKENDFIPRIWAMRKIGYLMSEIRLKGENKELVDEIVALSKEHGIMTPYTSFLVLEEEADHERWGITAQAAPEMKEKGRQFNMVMENTVGRAAIGSAKDIIALKGKKTAEEPALSTIKHAGAKTFYLKGGVWIDSKHKEGTKIKEIKYLSQEYFVLLRRKPKTGKYFALSKNIIILFEGECYRITE